MPWPTTSPGWSRPGSSAWTARQTPPSPPPPNHQHTTHHRSMNMQASTRLTVSQALVRYLAALKAEVIQPDGRTDILPYCAGVFAIFGHGNVAGLGEALQAEKDRLPTLRAHTEQGMANAAVAFAKAHFRQR